MIKQILVVLKLPVVCSLLVLFGLGSQGCVSTPKALTGVYRYHVVPGDMLEEIALRFDTTPEQIKRSNQLKRSTLEPGSILYIRPGPAGMQKGKHRLVFDERAHLLGRSEAPLKENTWNLIFGLKANPLAAQLRSGLFFSSASSGATSWQWPARGRIRSNHGEMRGRHVHEGIDISGPVGTPVYPSSEGKVVFVGRKRGYGKVVVIEHDHYRTLYAHLSSYRVQKGDVLSQSQTLGKMGRTGNATGPHLHFEIRDPWGYSINPAVFIQKFQKEILISEKSRSKDPA